jgi:PilZ domain
LSYALAIQPHREQADILRTHVSTKTRAKLTVVNSVRAAMTHIDHEIPNLVLVGPLMPPHEENQLVNRLKDVPPPSPLILMIPSLVAPLSDRPKKRLFDSLLNRTVQPIGCDPSAFAEQLSEYMREMEPLDSSSLMKPAAKGPGSERRAAARFERLSGAKVLINGEVVDLVDLSVTGAQVLSAMRVLRPSEAVQVKLWKEADAISCDGAIVWSSFETNGALHTPCYRAGITFGDAGQRALEQLYFSPSKAMVPVRSQPPSIVRSDADHLTRAQRIECGDVSWLRTVKLPWGIELRVVNISATGMLLESGTKIKPGKVSDLRLCSPEGDVIIPASFVRSEVADVTPRGVTYHVAVTFDKPLTSYEPRPVSQDRFFSGASA